MSSSFEDETISVIITSDVIDVNKCIDAVKSSHAGAISTFIGTTRDSFENKTVTYLSYEAYDEMALKEMKAICHNIVAKWGKDNIRKMLIIHKVGECPVSEISVLIAISSVHRKDSIEAVAYAIDELKKNVPIWKKEHYSGGNDDSVWKENVK